MTAAWLRISSSRERLRTGSKLREHTRALDTITRAGVSMHVETRFYRRVHHLHDAVSAGLQQGAAATRRPATPTFSTGPGVSASGLFASKQANAFSPHRASGIAGLDRQP
jgi:hypothetical protein